MGIQGRIQEFKVGAWAHGERVARNYNGGLGRAPSGVRPGAEPLVRGSGGEAP